jgi:5-methylcytosine-specific restriction endonuclease McrA
MEAVLVLNADYSILEIVSWQRAVSLMCRNQVHVVEAYADRFIRSASLTFDFPAVVARTKYVRPRRSTRFSRQNILARDAYTCQYCGIQPRKSSGAPRIEDLTIDHVIPRARARNGKVRSPWYPDLVKVTSWENILTACEPCNSKKADLSLKQVGFVPLKKPRPPTHREVAWMSLFKYEVPDEWKFYLPEGANGWRDYWTAELDSD